MNGLNVNSPQSPQDPQSIVDELMKFLRDAGYSGGLSELLDNFLKRGGKGRGSLIDGTGLAGSGLNFGGGGGEAGGGLSFTDLGGGV